MSLANLARRFTGEYHEPGDNAGFSVIKPPRRADAAMQTKWAIDVIQRWKKAREVGVLAIYPDEKMACRSRADRGTGYEMDTPKTKASALRARLAQPRVRKPRVRVPRVGNGKEGKGYHHTSIYDLEKRRSLVRKLHGYV